MGTPREQSNFEQLFLCHRQTLLRRAVQLTRGQSDDAKDLYQGTVERAWSTFDRIKHATNPRGWLMRIMYNLFVDAHRRREIHREISGLGLATATAPEPYEVVPWEFVTRKDLNRAMARLPRLHREVLRLSVIERHSYKQIAASLGVPVSTVGSRLHRARRRVRDLLLAPIELDPNRVLSSVGRKGQGRGPDREVGVLGHG